MHLCTPIKGSVRLAKPVALLTKLPVFGGFYPGATHPQVVCHLATTRCQCERHSVGVGTSGNKKEKK